MGSDPGSRASLPELKPGDSPEGASWYSFVPSGEGPSARVGQDALYLPLESGSAKGKVAIIAGANPDGSFSDSYFIDLESHRWIPTGWAGLLPRYEHAAFVPASQPTSLWVYGGASEDGNRNCLQVLELSTGTWEMPKVTGTPPSPRTYHTSTAAIGDRLYVFGGGEKGVDPVQDQQMHIFDSVTRTWLQPEVHGQPPSPRHGHITVAVGNRIFIHGGLAGDTFYDDLFSIDINEMKWEVLSATGSVPGGRAAHSAVAFQDHLYIFGGMDPTGALDTMYKFHIEKREWMKLEFKTLLPAGRLDHSMCILPWEIPSGGETVAQGNLGKKEAPESSGHSCQGQEACLRARVVHLCFIFGGMNMKGEIYEDCAITLLK